MDCAWVVHSDRAARLCCHAAPITFRGAARFCLSHGVSHLSFLCMVSCERFLPFVTFSVEEEGMC